MVLEDIGVICLGVACMAILLLGFVYLLERWGW